MMNSFSTLYLPGLFGQWKVWEKDLSKICKNSDKVIQLGNITGFNEEIINKKATSRNFNSFLLENVLSSWAIDENWIQILGANEVIMLTDIKEKYIDNEAAKVLRESYFSEQSNLKYLIATSENNRLITHGGLTYGEWENIGKPETAEEAANRLNEKYNKKLYFGESVRTGYPPQLDANPIFCDDILELYPSWLYAKESCPFEQVFAQTVNNTRGRVAFQNEYSPLYWFNKKSVIFPNIGSVLRIKDTQFIGLDINLNKGYQTSFDISKKLWIENTIEGIDPSKINPPLID